MKSPAAWRAASIRMARCWWKLRPACDGSFPAKSACGSNSEHLVSRHRQYPRQVGRAARRASVGACARCRTRLGAAGVAALVRAAPRDVERVVAVCVAGRQATNARSQPRCARASGCARSSSVRRARPRRAQRLSGYLAARRGPMGGRHRRARAGARPRPALVVNIGTALTIDAVTGNGRHLGGAIVPGPNTMIESLLAGTHGIRRRAQGARRTGSRRARAVRRRHRECARRRRRIRRSRIHRPRR